MDDLYDFRRARPEGITIDGYKLQRRKRSPGSSCESPTGCAIYKGWFFTSKCATTEWFKIVAPERAAHPGFISFIKTFHKHINLSGDQSLTGGFQHLS